MGERPVSVLVSFVSVRRCSQRTTQPPGASSQTMPSCSERTATDLESVWGATSPWVQIPPPPLPGQRKRKGQPSPLAVPVWLPVSVSVHATGTFSPLSSEYPASFPRVPGRRLFPFPPWAYLRGRARRRVPTFRRGRALLETVTRSGSPAGRCPRTFKRLDGVRHRLPVAG